MMREKLEVLAERLEMKPTPEQEASVLTGDGVLWDEFVAPCQLPAIIASLRAILASEPEPGLREELALYREEYEARHSYGHKQGITSPQAKRYQEAKRKLIVFRALARTPPQKPTAQDQKPDNPYIGKNMEDRDWINVLIHDVADLQRRMNEICPGNRP